MPWFKVDDQLFFNAKTVIAGNSAMGLWVRAGSWASANLTDGFIPTHMANAMANPMANPCDPDALVEAGLWEATEGGYQFHDWEDFQPSAAIEKEKRKKRAEAGRLGAMARWGDKPHGTPHGKSHSKSHADGMANEKQTDAPSRPVPSPKKKKLTTAELYDENFNAWWKLYPSTASKKPAAEAYHKLLNQYTPEDLTAKLRGYLHARSRAERQPDRFVAPLPNASTWLNQERWDDFGELVTVTRGGGRQAMELSRDDVNNVLGKDYWSCPAPPSGLSLQDEREWKQARAAEHLEERRTKAWEVMNRDSAA